MERFVESHTFGHHSVVVVEFVDNDAVAYFILLDGKPVTEPLPDRPDFEGIVRTYSRAVETKFNT